MMRASKGTTGIAGGTIFQAEKLCTKALRTTRRPVWLELVNEDGQWWPWTWRGGA